MTRDTSVRTTPATALRASPHSRVLPLAMPNAGSHTSLPASEFTTTFARFLDAHSDATPSERSCSGDAPCEARASQRSTQWRIGEGSRPRELNQPAAPVLTHTSRIDSALPESTLPFPTIWHAVCFSQLEAIDHVSIVRRPLGSDEVVSPDWGRNDTTGESS